MAETIDFDVGTFDITGGNASREGFNLFGRGEEISVLAEAYCPFGIESICHSRFRTEFRVLTNTSEREF